MKGLMLPAAIIAALLLLTTCSEPIDFIGEVTTEVKIANDLFLVVESVSPERGATNVNPQNPIIIQFDRAVLLPSVSTETLLINDGTDNISFSNPEFNSVTNVLSVRPDIPLQSEKSYTVTAAGIKGRDGSSLQNSVAWGFSTGKFPAGSFSIISQNANSLAGHSNSRTVNLAISVNNAGSPMLYYVSENEDFSPNIASGSLNPLDSVIISGTLSDGSDGTRTLYFMVACTIEGTLVEGEAVSVDIQLDRAAPVLSGVSLAGGAAYYTSTTVPLSYSVSDVGSRSVKDLRIKYNTTDYDGTFTGISSSPVATTVTVAGADYVQKTATVIALDRAGNSTQASDTIYIDTVAPNKTLISGTTPTLDRTPSWSWTSGGNGGVGRYKYSLNGGAYSDETTATGYEPTANLAYGSNTLHVMERDARHNWSNPSSKTIYVSPVYPFDGETGVSKTPTFVWPGQLLATYDLQGLSGKVWVTIAEGLTSSQFPITTSLTGNTSYTWRYVVHKRSSTTYSPSYSFQTRP